MQYVTCFGLCLVMFEHLLAANGRSQKLAHNSLSTRMLVTSRCLASPLQIYVQTLAALSLMTIDNHDWLLQAYFLVTPVLHWMKLTGARV